jgi:hypothetical protein
MRHVAARDPLAAAAAVRTDAPSVAEVVRGIGF